MCGIYGFASRNPGPVPLRQLYRVAGYASPRGSDACGAAGLVGGRLDRRRAAGPSCLHGEILEGFESARAIVGHAGAAATGDAQPIIRGDVAIVHAGDGEPGRLAAIAEAARGTPAERIRRAVESMPARAPHAILAIVAGTLVVSARGLPMYYQAVRDGVYLGSRCFETFHFAIDPVWPGVLTAADFRPQHSPDVATHAPVVRGMRSAFPVPR